MLAQSRLFIFEIDYVIYFLIFKTFKTPLIVATQHGMFEMIKKFIQLGADVNAKDIANRTPVIFFFPIHFFHFT